MRWDNGQEEPRRRTGWQRVMDWALFLLFCVLFTVIPLFWMLGLNPIQLSMRQRALTKRNDLRELAIECRKLCESEDAGKSFTGSEIRKLPEIVQRFNPRHVDTRPTNLIIEFGAGFFHYGYQFEKVPGDENHWRLLQYGEDEGDAHELIRL